MTVFQSCKKCSSSQLLVVLLLTLEIKNQHHFKENKVENRVLTEHKPLWNFEETINNMLI
jgi:hypothetical protein